MDLTTNEARAMDGEARDDLRRHDPDQRTIPSSWATRCRWGEARTRDEQCRRRLACDRLSTVGACGSLSAWSPL